jgi:hypothetical protein
MALPALRQPLVRRCCIAMAFGVGSLLCELFELFERSKADARLQIAFALAAPLPCARRWVYCCSR